MGYRSSLRGRIRIEPPVPAKVLAQSRFMPGDTYPQTSVVYDVQTVVRETDEGELTVRRVAGLVCPYEEEAKHYAVAEELCDIAAELPAGHAMVGELIRVGEENPDVERFRMAGDGRTVLVEQARVLWSDGTEFDLRVYWADPTEPG